MPANRRDFLKLSVMTSGIWMKGGIPTAGNPYPQPVEKSVRKLKILILGGTSFIGPPQVRYAQNRGHEITLFNRGKTNTHLFPEIEKLRGDRAVGNLDSLKGRKWDAVIDNSATNPDWVQDSANLLRDSSNQYLFISTRSVYQNLSRVPMSKDAPVFTYENTDVEPGEKLPYGLSKALAEKEAIKAFPGRTTILRPGLIIGPEDRSDRFTYWPVRISQGGEILAPGNPMDTVQIIDARDLSEWAIRLVENEIFGVFNAVGPRIPRPMSELLYGIRAVTSSETFFTWIDTEFLKAQKVRPYADLPVWLPPTGGYEGFARFDLNPEIEAGLTYRPLSVTALDTLEFHFSRSKERQSKLRAGLSLEREKELLTLWHARPGAQGPRQIP